MPRSVGRLRAKQVVDALLIDGAGHRHLAGRVQRIERLPRRIRVRDHFGQLVPSAIGALHRRKRARRGFDRRRRGVSPREAEQVERAILRGRGLRVFEPLHGLRDDGIGVRLVGILPVLLERVDRQCGRLKIAGRHRRPPAFVRRPVSRGRLHHFDVPDDRIRVTASSATLFMPKSNSSHATPATATTFKSMMRSGDGIIDCGSCAISRGAGMPLSRAMAAAADTRSCA